MLAQQESGGLDALILNAGGVRSWYTTTAEGYEQQFALNYLSGVLLTHRLLDALMLRGGRVLWTGSGSHKHTHVHWDDIMLQKRYSCLMAYKQSKVCACCSRRRSTALCFRRRADVCGGPRPRQQRR